jgi:regulator of protease activity HflC (stomatin/prohibitin superfamily)
VAVPVNLLAVNVPVQFQITNVIAWATRYTDAGGLLETLATREVVRYLLGVDINEIMTSGRSRASDDLRRDIQDQADQLNLGIRIIFVGMQGIHPPVKVAPAYQKVVGAMQEKEAKILTAEAYRARAVPMAQAEAARATNQALAYRDRTIADTAGRAAQFTNQIAAWQAAPQVFGQRAYLQALARSATGARKYVIAATNTQDVITLNLEDKLRPDLIDIPTSAPKSR